MSCWVQITTLSDFVINQGSGKLFAILNLSAQELLVTRLRLFCVYHSIPGYQNKTNDLTCELILQHGSLKAITHAVMTPMRVVTIKKMTLLLTINLLW